MRVVMMRKPGPPDVLEAGRMPQPEIESPTEVLVRVEAAGINPVDTKIRARGPMIDEGLPCILGCDGAGVVEAVGRDVRHIGIGDAVYYCYGGLGRRRTGNYAEYAIVDAAYIAPKPDSLDFVQAAAAPLVLITAWEALFDRARLGKGQKVLIHAGAGGVGHVAIQLARIAGAEVATTVSTEAKADFVRSLGADRVIRYRQEDTQAAVMDWTGGRGVDIAFDTVGGDVFKQSIPLVRFYGELVTILQVPENADWKAARLRNLHISQELMLSPQLFGLGEGAHQAGILADCAGHIDAGRLGIHVADTLPLEQAAEAHRRIERGGMTGKLVLINRDQEG
ncbi:MAG TPA: zinc-dependent alcohol dehydrogenase family protein [Mariprofundaceae bacterium]|nr:zinc-dependent alcohol dehydrogenase family protein [Mariprofundaceae bacterium]